MGIINVFASKLSIGIPERGGREDKAEAVNITRANIWAPVLHVKRQNWAEKYRRIFWKYLVLLVNFKMSKFIDLAKRFVPLYEVQQTWEVELFYFQRLKSKAPVTPVNYMF